MIHPRVSQKGRPQPEAAGRGKGWRGSQGDAASIKHSSHRPQSPHAVALAAFSLSLASALLPQIAGWIKMGLSSFWAVSPSSLKRFSGLPTACPTPSALQTTSACWPALGWKSPPHDGVPGGRELLFQKSSLGQRLWKYPILLETWIRETYIPSPPPFSPISLFAWLDFLQARPRSLPVVPALPQPLPNPVPHTQWPWERQKGGSPFIPCIQCSPLIFNYQGCRSY